jgi:hypothetical protein
MILYHDPSSHRAISLQNLKINWKESKLHILKKKKKRKVKLSLCLIVDALWHEDIWEVGGIAPLFLISALGGGEWSASHPGSFTTEERTPQSPLETKLSGPQSWSGISGVEKNLACQGTKTRPSSS